MARVFDILQPHTDSLGIAEYTVTQFPLEQIFNDFARRDANVKNQ
jgi:hypothetical protein